MEQPDKLDEKSFVVDLLVKSGADPGDFGEARDICDQPEGNCVLFVPGVDKGSNIEIVFRDMGKGQNVVPGIVVEDANGEVFLERPGNMNVEDLARQVNLLFANKENLRVEDGIVTAVIDGIRSKVSALGVFKPLDGQKNDAGGKAAQFLVQPKKKSARRIVTAVNKDDSFGKEQWRNSIMKMMGEIFPGGYESIPQDERLVLCFPGIGKEARMWQQYGFKNEEMIFIERNEVLAGKLRQNFPGAMVLCQEFGMSKNKSIKQIVIPICDKIVPYQRDTTCPIGLGWIKKSFAVINIDPENSLTSKMGESIRLLLNVVPFGKDCFVGVNFACKRESNAEKQGYIDILGNDAHKYSGSLDELRHKAVEMIIKGVCFHKFDPAFIDVKTRTRVSRKTKLLSTKSGDYEGESGTSRMFFAMHHLRSDYR